MCHSPGSSSRVPSLSTNKVTVVAGPTERVRASSPVGVGGLAGVVRPPGVVITIVCTSRARGPTEDAEIIG